MNLVACKCVEDNQVPIYAVYNSFRRHCPCLNHTTKEVNYYQHSRREENNSRHMCVRKKHFQMSIPYPIWRAEIEKQGKKHV